MSGRAEGRWRPTVPAAVLGAALLVSFVAAAPSAGVDLDHDHDPDILFGNQAQRDEVCLSVGGGVFLCGDLSTDMKTTRDVALGDVDGDGNVDAVLAKANVPNRVCLGDGSGSFTCADVSDGTDSSAGVALGDVDGDGDLDAVFANFNDRDRVCYGTGTGSFTCADVTTDTVLSWKVALGDVDGDLDLDAVFAVDSGRNRVCYGTGTGMFACADVSTDENITLGMALGDVDGDHDLDVVFANANKRNRVCYGTGTGMFACADVSTDENASRGVDLGDVDEDNDLDAVFANDGQVDRACYNTGSGNFSCADIDPFGLPSFAAALADVDSDDHLDVIFAHLGFQNRVCLGNGTGLFTCGAGTSSDRASTFAVAVASSVVDRVSGLDRYATAAAIAASRFPGGVDVAYIATGLNFPDALAAGPVAALDSGPILLVGTDAIPQATVDELTRLNPADIVIVGGTAAVSAGVESALATYTSGTVTRLFGPDRYATAAAISASTFSPGVDVAYIATGLNFPDALTGAPVAALNQGPILLVQTNGIPTSTATELTRLDPDHIVILGGTGAVSAGVATDLDVFTTGTVTRLSGPDRYATAAAISASRFAEGVPVAYIATGINFPDALAGSPVAYLNDGPILLVTTTAIPTATADELDRLRPDKIIILGGTGAVSGAVKAQLHQHTAP